MSKRNRFKIFDGNIRTVEREVDEFLEENPNIDITRILQSMESQYILVVSIFYTEPSEPSPEKAYGHPATPFVVPDYRAED